MEYAIFNQMDKLVNGPSNNRKELELELEELNRESYEETGHYEYALLGLKNGNWTSEI